jgi:hypothetical protein
MKMKYHKERLIWILVVLFFMSIVPSNGYKAAGDTQAIVGTTFSCQTDTDCPQCIGAGIENASTDTFFGELSHSKCVNGLCSLSDSCVYWDCNNAENCESVKATILQNTVGRFQESPALFLLIIGVILAIIFIE